MQEIEQLIRVLKKFGPEKLPLFCQESTVNNTLESKLYHNIKAAKYKNEEEALYDLYGNKGDYYKYRMLKFRLKQKLYNHLFFIEDNSRVPKQVLKKCTDLIHQGKALLLITEYALAIQFYKKALKTAKQYEFTDIILDCLTNLNFIYTQLSDRQKFYDTLANIKFYKKLKNDEDKAYEIYFVSKLELQKSVVTKKGYLKKLPTAIIKLKKLWIKSDSFTFFNYYYILNGWYLELIGDFEESIRDIKNCEALLKAGKINHYRFDTRLNKYSLIYALHRAKKYEEGLRLAPQYLKDFDPYSRNWFAYIDQYFLLAMHAGEYHLAIDLIAKVDQNPYSHRLKNKAQESWMLYKAYLCILNLEKSIPDTFHYQQFITFVPLHSKDKLGHNISILILQFLYLLKNKDYEQLYNREDSLRKYANSYLKDTYSKRSLCFFKMMLTAIRTDFDYTKCRVKTQPWLEKLIAAPTPGDAYAEVEIMPYEKLWEIILESLKR